MASVHFLIGPNKDEYTFERSFIEKNTFLDKYLHFKGKKTFVRRQGEKYYLLKNEPPELFRAFASFLYGGDFMWNEEVSNYFSYMGYHNDIGYPLDFWKIKLVDNWIRNNFYKLELSNPDSTLEPLLIERGPYVGLVDITDKFSKGSWMTKPRLTVEDLKKISKLVAFDGNIILAGGAIITFLMDYPRLPSDLDFFITSKDSDIGESKIREIIQNYFMINAYRNLETDWQLFPKGKPPTIYLQSETNPDYPASLSKVVRTENSFTIGCSNGKYQVILRLYTCPSEVVHGFDIDASGVFFDGEKVWATKRAAYSIEKKLIFFDFDRMSPTYGYRLAKYASRGFEVWLPRFDTTKVKWDQLAKIAESAEFKDGDEYVYWQKAPRYYSSVGQMNNMRTKPAVIRILERANPIDLILFALYFNYLPKLSRSDYKPRKTQKNHAEFIESNKQTGIGWWEIRGKGYVVFTTPPDAGDAVFNLTKETVEATGLTPQLNWKTQDPMAQLSGTFNPTTLANLDIWFDNAYLYGEGDVLLFEEKYPRHKGGVPPLTPTPHH